VQLTIAERLKLPINALKVAIDAQRDRTRGRGFQRSAQAGTQTLLRSSNIDAERCRKDSYFW
jgi:hypothetical protein